MSTANYYCSVPQCNSWIKTNRTLSFHKFPTAGKHRVIHENKRGQNELVDVRKLWILKLKIGKLISQYMKVCSLHFTEKDYIPRAPRSDPKRKILKKTAIPSVNLPTESFESAVSAPSTSSHRHCRLVNRNNNKDFNTKLPTCKGETIDIDGSVIFEHTQGDLEAATTLLTLLEDKARDKENISFQIVHRDNSTQVNLPRVETICQLLISDKDLSCFTGISNFKILDTLEAAVNMVYKDQRSHRLPIRDRIILMFTKFKLNLNYISLSTLFGISEILAKNYITDLIPILALILRSTIPFPSSSEIKRNMPECFRGFENVRIILDCTEIFIQKPKCVCCRIRFYSQYKSSLTVKFMTGISSGGLITFVSESFGGRASDKTIFEQSGLIQKLESGKDEIMVDKGFLIDDTCQVHNIGLIRPPFLKNKTQLSPEESQLNTKIAAARIHIERSNQRLKLFKILSEKLQWSLIPYISDIFTIICGITNLSSPILAESKFVRK